MAYSCLVLFVIFYDFVNFTWLQMLIDNSMDLPIGLHQKKKKKTKCEIWKIMVKKSMANQLWLMETK